MNKLSISRDGYTLNILDDRKGNDIPLMIVGSAVYYPKLFVSDVYDDLSIVYVDHRGFSVSTDANASFELCDIVEDIEAMRIELGINSMHLLGHSGHGFMAMAYAQKYPEHVETLILSNLAPMNTQQRQNQSIEYFETTATEERKQAFYKAWGLFQEQLKSNPTDRFSLMNIAMQAHSFYDYNYDGAYLWDDVINNMPALDHLWDEAFAVYDTAGFVAEYSKPILLLLSEYDYLVSPTNLWKDIVFDNDNVSFGQFSQSGHNPMLEEPLKYRKFLNLL